ncbi:hypothetical protein GCM10009000_009090 [Halobacterium noricense]|uniref:DDE domain-containing protein n=1 Tax=Haladaptatus pallidirubidus TaxID=1008152 RepID=A0AAV3UQN5_9EURY
MTRQVTFSEITAQRTLMECAKATTDDTPYTPTALLNADRSHQAIWQWKERLVDSGRDPPSASPTRVAVDEIAVQMNGEWYWVYAAIDVTTKMLLDIELFSCRGTDPATAFLHEVTEKHDLSEAVFLINGYGYLTAISRLGLSGRLDYSLRNHVERWFQTFKVRTDRFHTSWVGSRPAARRWFQQFKRYYNHDRLH